MPTPQFVTGCESDPECLKKCHSGLGFETNLSDNLRPYSSTGRATYFFTLEFS